MSFWTAAVIIVAIWAVVTVYSRRNDGALGVTRDEDGNPVFPPTNAAEQARELEELRERIKVLERIATDNNSLSSRETRQIAADIEALRDRQDG